MNKRRSEDKMKESKQERFKRIAEARVNKILSMLRLLGNCSFKGTYEYTAKQVEKVFQKLRSELDSTYQRFKRGINGTEQFTLTDMQESSLSDIQEEFPSVYLTLPDGSRLRASAVDDENFPAISIWLESVDSEDERMVCCAEYNSERSAGKELCIGVCCSNSEDPYFYESFKKDKSVGDEI